MNETGIIWTEATWNPMSGCHKITEGCAFCYAHTLAEQKRGTLAFPNGFDLTIRPHKLNEPKKLKNPTLIFANSMSDLFLAELPDSYRHQIIDVIEQTPQHEYQVLTKRPEAMLAFSKKRKLPKNFWAGTTVESKKTIHRIEIIKEIDAEIKFISAEPLLSGYPSSTDLLGINWVITGGESGSHLWQDKWQKERGLALYNRDKKKWLVKETALEWVRGIRDLTKKANASFFHKQWGGNTPKAAGRDLDGRTWEEFPRYPSNNVKVNNLHLFSNETTQNN
jgi:protein gp37